MIGKMLEEKRVAMGVEITDMAKQLGTTKQRLEQIEKDVTKNPGGQICLALSKAYKIPIKTLLENIGE
jgi:transcriptional regulator with XRE-family HTH domain